MTSGRGGVGVGVAHNQYLLFQSSISFQTPPYEWAFVRSVMRKREREKERKREGA